jgi:hypothetical protein
MTALIATITAWLLSGSPPHWEVIGGVVAYAHLEWWLPRTKLVRADSSLAILGDGLKRLLVHRIPLIGGLLTAMATPPTPPVDDDIAPVTETPNSAA